MVGPETLRWLAGYRFTGQRLGLRRGRVLLPGQPAARRRGHLRRGGAARDAGAVDPQPRLRGRRRRQPDDRRRAGPALHRDGVAADPRGGRGRRRPGRLRRRLRRARATSRPAAATASRRSGTARARVHPAARRRAGGLRGAGRRAWAPGTTLLVDTYDVEAGVRTAVEVAGTGLGAVRLDSGDLLEQARAVREPARRSRRHRHPDHRHQRPRRVRRSPRSPRPRSTPTASAPRWSPGRARPTAGLVYKLVAREDADGRAGRRGQEAARTRPASAGASGRCAGAAPDGVAEAEVLGDRHAAGRRRRRPAAAACRSSRPARSSGASRWTRARARHAASLAELPRRPPAVPRRARHPDASTRRPPA